MATAPPAPSATVRVEHVASGVGHEAGRIVLDVIKPLAVIAAIIAIIVLLIMYFSKKLFCNIPILGNLVCKKDCWGHPDAKVDPLSGDCYVCPKGMTRTADPIDSKTACAAYGAAGPLYGLGLANKYCRDKYGSHAFADPTKQGCFTCPDGMNRTIAGVTSSSACAAGVGALSLGAKNYCSHEKSGAFPDGDGNCYTCPKDMARTAALINSSSACSAAGMNPLGALSKDAKNYCDNVKSGSFPDSNGACYSCPDHMSRTAAVISSSTACSAAGLNPLGAFSKDAIDFCHRYSSSTFPDANGGCYGCPEDMARTAAPINTATACAAGGLAPWNSLTPEAKKYCHRFDDRGFPSIDGKCYKCPDGYQQTLLPAWGPSACIKKGSVADYHGASEIGKWSSGITKRGDWAGPVTRVGHWVGKVDKVGAWVSGTSNKGPTAAHATLYGKATS